MRADPYLKRNSKGAEVEKLFAELSLDEETVTEFAVYGDPRGSTQASNGLMRKGVLNPPIVKKLITKGWTEQDFDGRRIYADPQNTSWLTTFNRKSLFLKLTLQSVSCAATGLDAIRIKQQI